MKDDHETRAAAPAQEPLRTVKLRDGSELVLYKFVCPLEPDLRRDLTGLLNNEWPDGDFHWSQSMTGQLADSLTVVVCPAMRRGQWVGTASVVHPVREPRVAAVCDVTTLSAMRGLGVARATTQAVTDHALEQGVGAIHLGTTRQGGAWRVYERVGYKWLHDSGGVMRHVPAGSDAFDDTYFRAGQPVSIRPTQWGDLPGVSALLAVPYDALAGDYTRGIFSPKYTFHPRCVSAFTTIHYGVEATGGQCLSLIGESAHQVLGLASITPLDTAYRKHVGALEIMTHDHYTQHGPVLLRAALDAAKDAGVRRAIAHVPALDTLKAQWLTEAGAETVGRLKAHMMLGEKEVDFEIFELALNE